MPKSPQQRAEYRPPSITPIERPRVRYFGPFSKPTGYAQAGHDYLAALHAAGVDLEIWLQMEANTDDLPFRYHGLIDLVGKRPDFQPTHVVVHTIPTYSASVVLPEAEVPPGVPAVLLTTWETTKIGAAVAEEINDSFDLVVVPSEFNARAFRDSGIERVAVVPHTFDPAAWPASPERPAAPFVFYTIGVWGERKNLMGVLKAYLSTFRSGDDVVLRVVTPFVVDEDLQHLAARMGLTDLPRLEFVGVGRRLTEAELLDVHRSSHCYVSATRGEAWGLGAFEAALMGNPVLMPGFGGQRDFLAGYPGWLEVPYFLTPAIGQDFQVANTVEIAGIRIQPMAAGVPTGLQADQQWAEPDLGFLQDAMRSLARTAPGAGYQARADYRSTLDKLFGYRTVSLQFVAALHEASKIRARLEEGDPESVHDEQPFREAPATPESWNNDFKP
jgi:glycosyltransferase involved in cell wall biosynthesis